jgi:hypothetical protein
MASAIRAMEPGFSSRNRFGSISSNSISTGPWSGSTTRSTPGVERLFGGRHRIESVTRQIQFGGGGLPRREAGVGFALLVEVHPRG